MIKKKAKTWSKILYLFITFTFLVYGNILISNSIINRLTEVEKISNAFLSLTYIKNTGAAFSMLQNSIELLIVLSTVALILIFAYTIYSIRTMSMIGIFWMSILMSGIFCNLRERVIYGYVRDFFDITVINFPVFNISDILINLGVIAIIILMLKRTRIKQL